MMETPENWKFNKTIKAMLDWSVAYGMIRINDVKEYYLIEFATGGWSENETAAESLRDIYTVYDSGGYYLVEFNKYSLTEEQKNFLTSFAVPVLKKKQFVYKVIR